MRDLELVRDRFSMAAWLKLGYHTDAQEDPRYWTELPWVSDSPGRHSPWWSRRARPRIGQSYPPHGPCYEVGDRLVMYLTGPKKCPAILEVTREPRWDPDRVDRDAAPGEGDTWGVLTEVRAVAALPLSEAPALQLLDVAPASISRKGHISLSESQYEEAERLITGSRRWQRDVPATSERIPIEERKVEGYDLRGPKEIRRAERREAGLVSAFAATIKAQGDVVSSNKLRPKHSNIMLRTDLFNWTRNQLIEAKASTSRNDIRMAIGQLADYAHTLRLSRALDREPEKAVLLVAKPQPALIDLLASQGIKAIWQEGDGFADNANGAFT